MGFTQVNLDRLQLKALCEPWCDSPLSKNLWEQAGMVYLEVKKKCFHPIYHLIFFKNWGIWLQDKINNHFLHNQRTLLEIIPVQNVLSPLGRMEHQYWFGFGIFSFRFS